MPSPLKKVLDGSYSTQTGNAAGAGPAENFIIKIRDFLFEYIPGEGDVDYVYFGVIIYLLLRIVVKDKWGGFITYLIFTIIFVFTETSANVGFMGLLSNSGEMTSKLGHLLAIPLLFTALTGDKE
jgi:hypothetical protein